MEKLNFNSVILCEILNDNEATEELKEYLNAVIDEELTKGDDMDCDLIDECINAISELELEEAINTPHLISLVSEKDFIKKIQRKSILQKSKYKKVAVICASVVILFAVGSIKTQSGETIAKKISDRIAYSFGIQGFDSNDEEKSKTGTKVETTNPDVTSGMEETTEQVELTTETEKGAISLTKIYGVATKALKTEYILGEKLDLNGLKLFAVYSDYTEKQIPLEKCTVSVPKKFATDVGIYKITIIYQNKEYSYDVKVYAEKSSVVLNSIYGTFPDDFTFKIDSFENIDMSVVKVTAVYSDGSEKNIPISKCDVTIEENFMDIENKAIVTVTYEERSFSFVMTKEAT